MPIIKYVLNQKKSFKKTKNIYRIDLRDEVLQTGFHSYSFLIVLESEY